MITLPQFSPPTPSLATPTYPPKASHYDDEESLEYTDDEGKEGNISFSSDSDATVKAAPVIRRKPQNKTIIQKSSAYDTDDESDTDDDEGIASNDDDDMKDPFGFGNKDPFAITEEDYGFEFQNTFVPTSSPPKIPITEAKQRILACCRDLGISEENEIRYCDLQKIYQRHFGVALDKAELTNLFGPPSSASEVLQKDLGTYLKVTLAKDSEDNIMKMTAKKDIRKALHELENNVIYGILKPIPELSAQVVEEVLKSRSRFDAIVTKTNLNQRITKRDIANLRAKGFARENFSDLPQIRNPVIMERDEEGTDEYTDDENEMKLTQFMKLKPRPKYVTPADPNFGKIIPPRNSRTGSRSSNTPRSKTSSLLQNRRPKHHGLSVDSEEDSDVWTDEEEDRTPLYLYREPHGLVYRERLNVTAQSRTSGVHNPGQRFSSDEDFMHTLAASHHIELFGGEDFDAITSNSNTSESTVVRQQRPSNTNSSTTGTNEIRQEINNIVFPQQQDILYGHQHPEIQNESVQFDSFYNSFQNAAYTFPQGDITQASAAAFMSNTIQEDVEYLDDQEEVEYSDYEDESLGFIGKD